MFQRWETGRVMLEKQSVTKVFENYIFKVFVKCTSVAMFRRFIIQSVVMLVYKEFRTIPALGQKISKKWNVFYRIDLLYFIKNSKIKYLFCVTNKIIRVPKVGLSKANDCRTFIIKFLP